MTYFQSIVLFCLAFVLISNGMPLSLSDSPCGGWTPYKNEKCVKLVVRAGLQTKEDAEVVCSAFSEEFHGEEVPKLVTVQTEDKQTFLQKLVFEELHELENVWLGLELGNDDLFRWNDGTELLFANWIEETVTESERRCVQMESGEGTNERGKWVRVNCKKMYAVVCERTPPWSVAELLESFLSLKLEVARNNQAWEQKLNEATLKINEAHQKIAEANQNITDSNQEIANLKQNPVPIGFIYVQLPEQEPPTTLWPQTSWKDVGSDYAGLFFRVEGGQAAPFGQVQEDNTRRFSQVQNTVTSANVPPTAPPDEGWSPDIWTGTNAAGSFIFLKFRLTMGEIRPRNKSVKIWQRIK